MAELSDNTNWFETDASNNKAPPNGWPEGMMPSGVNDTARGDKGALKRFWDRINPVQTIAPASGLWQFTTANSAYPTGYVDGEIYSFKATAFSVGGDQFQVNALGVKPIWRLNGTPIIAQDIVSSGAPQIIYQAALNGGAGAFLLLNPAVSIYGDGTGGISAAGGINTGGGISAAGLIQTTYNGSGSGGEAIYATAGGIRSDAGGTALYLPNGNLVCQGVVANSQVACQTVNASGQMNCTQLFCNTIAASTSLESAYIQADQANVAIYAANGDIQAQRYIIANTDGFKPGGGPWSAISDIRIKENVETYTTGLDAVQALRPVTYFYNGKGGTVRSGRRHIGLIADEVLPVMPEMVGTISKLLDPGDSVPTEIKTLDTTSLIFALVNCIKELAARVASLEADVRD